MKLKVTLNAAADAAAACCSITLQTHSIANASAVTRKLLRSRHRIAAADAAVAEVLTRRCFRCHLNSVHVGALKRCYICSCRVPNPHVKELHRRCPCFGCNQAATHTIAATNHGPKRRNHTAATGTKAAANHLSHEMGTRYPGQHALKETQMEYPA